MEIILSKRCESITGKYFAEDCGYYIVTRTKNDGTTGYFTTRRVPYTKRYSDSRHATYIRLMAEQAVGTNPFIEDIRLTVREFINARGTLVCGRPLHEFDAILRRKITKYWCGIITMRLRKVKPNSILTAKDVVKLKDLLRLNV
jgi:hypothetical protein